MDPDKKHRALPVPWYAHGLASVVHEGAISLVCQELGYGGMTRQGSRRLSRPTTMSKVAGVADFRILTNREGTTGFRTHGINSMGPISSRSDCEAARGARSFRKDAGDLSDEIA